jgi:hypothetical protein
MKRDNAVKRWQDLPERSRQEWGDLFDGSTAGLDVAGACPVCGAHALHRWYFLHRARVSMFQGREWAGDGSQWQWCSHCHSYEHSSALVPVRWNSPLSVSFENLMHDPDPIEGARLEMINSSQADSD